MDVSVELMNSHRFKCQSDIKIKEVLTNSRRRSINTLTNKIWDKNAESTVLTRVGRGRESNAE